MPKGRAEHAKIGPEDYEHAGSSVGDLRGRFLFFIRRDTPQVMEALLALDGSDPGLLAWAKDWHLQDEWITNVARRTLDDWRTHPALATELHWASAIQPVERIPEPPAIRWVPTLESAAQFLYRARHEYVPDVRRWANTVGLVGTPQKPKIDRDLGALVQYHVKGDDLDAVADEFFGGADKEDIARKAITSLSNLIGLTLRK
jgi:hypothetical protein